MKNITISFVFAFAMLLAGYSQSVVKIVTCVQLDPLQKVFTEDSCFVEISDTAAVAKGETTTFQFVIKSSYPIKELKVEAGNLINGKNKIFVTKKAFVGYELAKNYTRHPSKDAVRPVSNLFPDPLIDMESMDVDPVSNQPVWIEYAIPHDAASGNYSATLVFTGKVNGKKFKVTKKVNAKVYPVTLPEQTLWITNWFIPNSTKMAILNDNQPVKMFSDRFWELLTVHAHVMRDHGQNTYLIGNQGEFYDFLGELCNFKIIDTQFTFDFTNFDKMVELFIREGGLKRIEGGHIGARTGNWQSDFGVFVPKVGIIPFDDVLAQNFLTQFLPALHSHLKNKGWDKMYIQHVADEPFEPNAASYIRLVEFVKSLMPGVPVIDAVMYSKLANSADIWVPKLDTYHRDYSFYQERQAAGNEVWFYTCVEPQGNYANRFLEQPLIQTRLLHWINYRYGATGYLHWGFNQWDKPGFPAGDAWIIYPFEGKVYSSMRLAAMRDGIADYELLKLLEQKSPEKAKELARTLIKDFNSYDSNIQTFRQTRLKLLKWLSEI